MSKPTEFGPLGLVKSIISAVVLAGLAISFTISFVSFVYSGDLAIHLSKALGLAFLGLAVMAVITGLLTRFPGSISHAQDAPALLLATAAASLVVDLGDDTAAVFPTIATFIATAALLTGLSMLLAWKLKLGSLTRFIPYSVVGGFLAATGVLLTLGAFGMIVKHPVSIWSIPDLFTAETMPRLIPWILFSISVVILTRKLKSQAIIPTSLVVGGALFFGVIFALDLSIQDASDMGLLIGPFEGENFLSGVDLRLPTEARWDLIMSQAPSLFAVVAISVLGLLLNTGGMEIEEKTPVNFEAELKAAGFGNIGAGFVGGMTGYHLLSETLLARRMGLTSYLGALTIAAMALVVIFAGTYLVGVIPVGLMASVIMILGLDLTYDWLCLQWRRSSPADMVIIFAIVLTAVTIGFLPSLLVGLIIAAVFFVISYSRINAIAVRTDGSLRQSFVERSRDEMTFLQENGQAWRIYELRGYIFFGSANGLYERVREDLDQTNAPHTCVLNFAAVSGIDSSALFSFSRINDLCKRLDVTLVLTGLSEALARKIAFSDELAAIKVFDTLDDALIDLEASCLASSFFATGRQQDMLTGLRSSHPNVDFDQFIKVIRLAAGEVLIEEGTHSKEVFQLNEGKLAAEVHLPDGQQKTVAQFLPGAMLGELAALADVPRTASIRATTPAVVTVISLADIPQSLEGRSVQADLSLQIAKYMAQRIIRMTNLMRNSNT